MKTVAFAASGLAVAALILAGCATAPRYDGGDGDVPRQQTTATVCAQCGIVTRIDSVQANRTAPTAAGAVLGGIVGAVAGRQISKETGGSKGNKNVSSVAGAAAGAVAGNAIQNRVTGTSYDIQVKMDDGRVIMINQKELNGVTENARVRLANGRVVLR